MKKHSALISLALFALVLAGACNSGDAIVDPPLVTPVTPPVTVSPVDPPPPPITPVPPNCRRHPELCD